MPLLSAIGLSFIPAFGYAWIVYWIDHYEREPKRLLVGAFLWCGIVAVIGALILSLVFEAGIYFITNDESLAD